MVEYNFEEMAIDRESLEEAVNGLLSALGSAFHWSDTPQGYRYWENQALGYADLDVDTLKEMLCQYDAWCVAPLKFYLKENTREFNPVDKPIHYGQGKIESDGGPSSYYDFPSDWVTLNDYIEFKSEYQWGADSFHLANITKAGCRWGDKNGTSKPYDAKKIVYSALRILRRLRGADEVQKFLKELSKDEQFRK